MSNWPRRVALLSLIPLVIALTAMPAQAKKKPLPWPRHFKSVTVSTATPGLVTIRWKAKGKKGHTKTKSMKIETGLSQFSPYTKKLPTHGRHSHVFWAKWKGKGKGHFTFGAKQLAQAGAPVGSGNTVYYRLWSVNKKGKRHHLRGDGTLRTFTPRGFAPSGSRLITIGSYNVRSAGLDKNSSHDWYHTRLPQAAANIAGTKPGIMLLQEALPTADNNKWNDNPNGTTQLQTLVNKLNGSYGLHYAATRYDYYDTKATEHLYAGTQQGMRILYDTNRYKMLSNCHENPAARHDNGSCAIMLPILSGDSAQKTRWAAFAEFQPIDSTGKLVGSPFWVVSLHLDARTGAKYNALRLRQMTTITNYMNKVRGSAPVIIGGDFNDFQNDQLAGGNNAHDYLVGQGYYDTAAAYYQTNLKYSTITHFAANRPGAAGTGTRLDMILTKGIRGANAFQVKLNAGSDHNMIVATTKLP